MAITTRSQFKEYCLRRLGFPVIELNLDDDQIEDAPFILIRWEANFRMNH